MQARGRPKKYRIVRLDPKISQFSPRGKAGRPNEVDLSMDEFEALRLADYMGLPQKEAAKSMHISQQTFSRVFKRAHKNIANALVNGNTIKIQGGHYVISSRDETNPARSQNNPT
ncbi:MAG: DUF134 domain-containing protein [Candidatus Omnitrophota bacterium]|jgi:predicted DNA-binding protein (UPF0251 family)